MVFAHSGMEVFWLLLLSCCLMFGPQRAISLQLNNISLDAEPDSVAREKRALPPRTDVFSPINYEGYNYRSVWWLAQVNWQTPRCLVTFIARYVAVTPCECVVVESDDYPVHQTNVNPYNHSDWLRYGERPRLVVEDPGKFRIRRYWPWNEVTFYRVLNVAIHPKCDGLYKYNIALVGTTKINDMKLAWIHTGESVLFASNAKRVLSSAILNGHCKVPYYNTNRWNQKDFNPDRPQEYITDFLPWEQCLPNVCPEREDFTDLSWDDFVQFELGPEREKTSPLVREVCLDRVAFTKRCAYTGFSTGNCPFIAGTPLFCEVGDLSGLFGFIVKATFTCPHTNTYEYEIFQELSIGFSWFKDFLTQRQLAGYKQHIPPWIANLNEDEEAEKLKEFTGKYDYDFVPETTPSLQVGRVLSVFADDMADSIVNVYYDGRLICQATQVAPKHFVLPCYCLHSVKERTLNRYTLRLNNWTNPYADEPVKFDEYCHDPGVDCTDIRRFFVRKTADDFGYSVSNCKYVYDVDDTWNKPKDRILCFATESYVHPQCDSHFLQDYAMITTYYPVNDTKSAWFQTHDPEYFSKAMDVFLSSQMLSGECYLIYFNDSTKGLLRKYIRVKIESYDFCTPLSCNPLRWQYSTNLQDACWNGHYVTKFDSISYEPEKNSSRLCITSYYDKFLCDYVRNGSPVFCESDVLRGLIGWVSMYHMVACDSTASPDGNEFIKQYNATSAVITRLDKLIGREDQAVIGLLERDARFGTFSAKSLGPQVLPTSVAFLLGVATLVLS